MAENLDDQLIKFNELRRRIDALRLENQELRIEREILQSQIARSSGLRFHLNSAIQLSWNKLVNQAKKIYTSSQNSPNQENNFLNDGSTAQFAANFKPYPVQIIQPVQANRPRVLHAVGNFHTGGSSRLIVDLIEHLGHRYEQPVITRDYPQQEGYTGLTVQPYNFYGGPDEALAILKNLNPDFIHMHYLGLHHDEYCEMDWQWYNNVFLAAKACGCRIIQNINIPTDPYVSDLVDYYVYVSDYVKREFGHLNDCNVTIYPGSDINFFSRKAGLEVPNNCIGMVYRLEEDKLNKNSIDVFIKVVQSRPGTKALIVGGGINLDLYKNKVAQAGLSESFTFTGYTSYTDLPAYYAKMSLFVAPVHTESFGQVSAFAMGMGLPVVGYNVGAIPEIIGDSSLVAPSGDSSALAAIILDLLANPEKSRQIGYSNRKRAEQLFSVEAMIRSYNLLYEKMMNANAAVGVDSQPKVIV